MRISVALAISTLMFGCSTSEQDKSPAPGSKAPTPVAEASWGASPGQLGRSILEEASPLGPSSLHADANGQVYVLDRVNARIETFADGKPSGSIALPGEGFEDFDLDPGGGFVLLRRHPAGAIVYVDAQGTLDHEVPLAGVVEAGMVTALFRQPDGVWLEVRDAHIVHVTDDAGQPAAHQRMLGGRFDNASKRLLRAVVRGNSVVVQTQKLAGGPPAVLARLDFAQRVKTRTLLASGADGRVFVGATLEGPQSAPDQPPSEVQWVVALDATGHELERFELPPYAGDGEVLRSARLGLDGKLYAMTASEQGVQIVQVTP